MQTEAAGPLTTICSIVLVAEDDRKAVRRVVQCGQPSQNFRSGLGNVDKVVHAVDALWLGNRVDVGSLGGGGVDLKVKLGLSESRKLQLPTTHLR